MKKIIKAVILTVIILAIILSTGYGIIKHGVPLDTSVTMGTAYIHIPVSLNEQDKDFSVMSFNIKCIDAPEKDAHLWTNRKQSVQNIIDVQDADIIGLQEVTQPQYNYFIKNMRDEYGYYGIYRSGLNLERADKIFSKEDPKPTNYNRTFTALIIDEASPIFYNKSRYELLDYDTFWLSESPEKPSYAWGAKHRRICTYVKLKDHYTGKIVSVINTHFDGIDLAKQKSAELINRYIAEKGLINVIVMGDFNAIEGSPAYNELVNDSLSNSKFLLPEAQRSTGPSSNGFGKFDQDLPIDHILIQQASFDVITNQIITDKINDDTFISDHYPVVAKLKQKL